MDGVQVGSGTYANGDLISDPTLNNIKGKSDVVTENDLTFSNNIFISIFQFNS